MCGPSTPECNYIRPVRLLSLLQLTTVPVSPPLEANETFKSAYQATRDKYLRTPPPVDTSVASMYPKSVLLGSSR